MLPKSHIFLILNFKFSRNLSRKINQVYLLLNEIIICHIIHLHIGIIANAMY
jgi:hypothetical protein